MNQPSAVLPTLRNQPITSNMTSRRAAGILHVLALTLILTAPSPRAFADGILSAAVKKSAGAEGEAEAASKLDLARDLATKLVRPGAMKFESHRMKNAGKMDYFLVYFGAHWCPNCKKFTPKLTEFYREQRSPQRRFEVIFVSADKDEDAMLQYMNGYRMPWPAVKFGEQKSIASLVEIAGRGYPCVVLVDAKAGKVIAHSYGEGGKGDYVGPTKPLEALKAILDKEKPRSANRSVARSGR